MPQACGGLDLVASATARLHALGVSRHTIALVAVTLTTCACHVYLHFRRPAVPNDGVLVGASGPCERECVLYRDQVIRSIDGVPVEDAVTVYRTLADGGSHTLAVSYDDANAVEIVASWTARDLIRTPLVAAADVHGGFDIDRSVGLADRHRAFFGIDRQWIVPDDLFGEPYVVVDVPTDPPYSNAMILALSLLKGSPVPIFAVRPSRRLEFDAAAWTSDEREALADKPWIRIVTAPVTDQKELFGRRLFDESGYVEPPQVHLVDCHGVVRMHEWDLHWGYPQSYVSWAPEAFQLADVLVEDARSGRCWLPFGVDG